jgi:hypothetical protein
VILLILKLNNLVDIFNLDLNSVALSTSYSEDVDLRFKSFPIATEEGISYFKERHLKNVTDRKINNYSSIYLTDKINLSEMVEIESLEDPFKGYEPFNTSISDNFTGLYLTVSAISGSSEMPYYFTTKGQRFLDQTIRIFDIILLNDTETRIKHRTKYRYDYYLTYSSLDNTCKFQLSSNNYEDTVFNYILDKKNNKLGLFKKHPSHEPYIPLRIIDNKLKLDLTYIDVIESTNPVPTSIINSYLFDVNFYIQNLLPKIDTSWISYNPLFNNSYEPDPQKSRFGLKNNYIISTQYSYITGNTLESNILTLKNQKTNKNYSYRSDFMEKSNDNVPTVDNRTYYGLYTGNDQEKGDFNITTSYEFYNTDYRMESDAYTIFFTPESLYPYKQININDLNWDKMGAIAGENPYLSDKIFQKRTGGDSGSEYLCSWLHKNRKGDLVWLDRYYYPLKTTFSEALRTSFNYEFSDPTIKLFLQPLYDSKYYIYIGGFKNLAEGYYSTGAYVEGKLDLNGIYNTETPVEAEEQVPENIVINEYYDVPFVYNTLEEELAATPQTIKTAIYGRSFYDKRSDLVILPNSEYVYHRIGNDYVKEALKTIEEVLIENGLNLKNSTEGDIYFENVDIDEQEYVFNNNTYAMLNNYSDINDTHQYTICFWMKSEDWKKKFGYQIFGNLNHKGFALLDDRRVTPFVTLQNGLDVYTYNTDFNIINVASVKNENFEYTPKIQDVYKTDHLDNFYLITTRIIE